MGYLPVLRLNRMPSKNRTHYPSPMRRKKRREEKGEEKLWKGERRRKRERRDRGKEDT